MLCHIVLLKLDPTANLAEVRARIEGYRGSVESVQHAEVVTDLGIFADNPTIGLLIQFRDRAAFERYLQDPEHVTVHEYMHPITKKLWSLQYETSEDPMQRSLGDVVEPLPHHP